MPETPDTDYFGLTRVGEGEGLNKNGFAALDLDRVLLDDLLNALVNHNHDATPRLGDPVGSPSLFSRTTGGTLPPNTTLYYRVSYVDKWGLETSGSAESSITTTQAIASPTSVAASIETAGGTLTPGLYSYVATYSTADGGETIPGPRTEVRIDGSDPGAAYRIRVDLPDLIASAATIRVYRSRPGQTQYYFLFETSDEFFYDDGVIIEDSTVTIPGFNTTNSANSVEVTVPGGALPEGVFGWKLYRSLDPGAYTGYNLVHYVVESTTPLSNDIRLSWIDAGEATERGEPRENSSTVSGGSTVELSQIAGKFPIEATPRGARSWTPWLGGPLMSDTYAMFNAKHPISPTQIATFFALPPVTTPTGAQVSVRIEDSTGQFVEMLTDGSGDRYHYRTFPTTNEGTFEAERGERTEGIVPIVTDLKASNGQGVELNEASEFVEYDFEILDAGRYQTYVVARKSDLGTGPLDDLAVDVLNSTTSAVLTSRFFTLSPDPDQDFVELGPIEFYSDGFSPVKVRVTKATTDPATYIVDTFRYVAELTTLVPGDVALKVAVGDLPNQDYSLPPYPVAAHWRSEETHRLVTSDGDNFTTLTFSTSDLTAQAYTVASDQAFVVVDPTSGNAATAVITATVDFTALAAGERAVALVTITSNSHQSRTVQVVALKAPADMGADANVTVLY